MANQDIRQLYTEATRAAFLGLVVNLALGVVKLFGGLVGSSFALVSDAVNSLGDMFASVVVLIALHVAQQPPDDEHPYGHTRAEAIAGSNVALLIILSAAVVGWEAVRRIGSANPMPQTWLLWVAGANVLIKEGLYRYKVAVGRRTGSSALIANAWDHRGDACCSLAVFFSLAARRWGGPQLDVADEIAAMIVVAIIFFAGVRLFWKSASELMDVQAESQLVEKIRDAARHVPDVKAVEKLWVRKSGLEYFADIHIEVDKNLTVATGHEIGHAVKNLLLDEFTALRDVLVHLEPFPHTHDTDG